MIVKDETCEENVFRDDSNNPDSGCRKSIVKSKKKTSPPFIISPLETA